MTENSSIINIKYLFLKFWRKKDYSHKDLTDIPKRVSYIPVSSSELTSTNKVVCRVGVWFRNFFFFWESSSIYEFDDTKSISICSPLLNLWVQKYIHSLLSITLRCATEHKLTVGTFNLKLYYVPKCRTDGNKSCTSSFSVLVFYKFSQFSYTVMKGQNSKQ